MWLTQLHRQTLANDRSRPGFSLHLLVVAPFAVPFRKLVSLTGGRAAHSVFRCCGWDSMFPFQEPTHSSDSRIELHCGQGTSSERNQRQQEKHDRNTRTSPSGSENLTGHTPTVIKSLFRNYCDRWPSKLDLNIMATSGEKYIVTSMFMSCVGPQRLK